MQEENTENNQNVVSGTKRWKAWALVFGVALLVFILMNFPYFWVQIKFMMHKPSVQSQAHTPTSAQQPQIIQSNVSGDNNVKAVIYTAGSLQIPSLGIDVPVVYVDQPYEKVFQEALINGVVHYPGTAMPGQAGNVYIFGHSSDYIWSKGHYKTAFALLPSIELGAEITLSDASGKIYTYKVVDKFVVGPKDTSVLKQDASKHILTVQTSYPVGTALRRYITVAELQQ